MVNFRFLVKRAKVVLRGLSSRPLSLHHLLVISYESFNDSFML